MLSRAVLKHGSQGRLLKSTDRETSGCL